MLVIDGSFGEGGGQILRTSLSLAALTGTSITIENIRARRDKPGLRPQHLTSALATAEICSGALEGAEVGSTRIVFRPGKIKPGYYEFDVSENRASAGSVNLIFQTILWPLVFAGKRSKIVLKGGTHVPFSPSSDYISRTFLPAVSRMGLQCRYQMQRAGYYPAGGGEVVAEIQPIESLQAVSLLGPTSRWNVELVSAISNLHPSIAERQLNAGLAHLRSLGVVPNRTELLNYPSRGKGTLFFIDAKSDGAIGGFQSLGELKKRAEDVAKDACEEFKAYHESLAALDKHLSDQLIIPMALADGLSQFTTCEVTQHLVTNISVVERFLDVRFEVTGQLGKPGTVRRVK
ncbi:MAG: RNA 3'-terminal phosphate cyclase [Armatimonadota bacterium]|nr:RNA 3'-terminal phosphate cyclase [Armatimonadota bacterium]